MYILEGIRSWKSPFGSCGGGVFVEWVLLNRWNMWRPSSASCDECSYQFLHLSTFPVKFICFTVWPFRCTNTATRTCLPKPTAAVAAMTPTHPESPHCDQWTRHAKHSEVEHIAQYFLKPSTFMQSANLGDIPVLQSDFNELKEICNKANTDII